jgi:hypothetical protein
MLGWSFAIGIEMKSPNCVGRSGASSDLLSECFLVISLSTLHPLRKIPTDINLGLINVFLDNSIISSKKRTGIVAQIDFSTNEQLWRLDIPQLTGTDSKTGVGLIYPDTGEGNLYILSGSNVICVKFSGSIEWVTPMPFKVFQMV